MEPTSSATAVGWWEDEDQLNQMAAFLEPRSIGAVACTCRFARDNLRDANANHQTSTLAQLVGPKQPMELAAANGDLDRAAIGLPF